MAFKRAFGRGPEDLARFAGTPWGRDLLGLWRPAGQSTSGNGGVRLAVRNGTLNFYRRGQSVAKVGFGRDKAPYLEVHVAYVTGEKGLGQHYARLSSTELYCNTFDGPLPSYEGLDTLARWVARADGHKGDEKEFVDKLVTHNPQVIDLEMGLSDYKPEAGKSTAPRMDLVALEDFGGALRIVFWEAKMMNNGELRCQPGTKDPHIVGQLNKYTTWLGQGKNEADVIEAYQANCCLLVDLHALARGVNSEIKALDPTIIRAAKGPPLAVDDRPRVIVRDPDTNKSWTSNGHDLVLIEKHGIHVQLISGTPRGSYILQRRA